MSDIDRRRFLAGSAAATVTAAAAAAVPGGGLLGARKVGASPVQADPRYRGKRHVAVLGGGCGGLSVAHELLDRGFTVDVYERNPVAGGKCRSMGVPGSGAGGRPDLPGEHGFRFFPGYYRHVTDTMARIPYGTNRNGVKDNLVFGEAARFSRQDNLDIQLPYKRLFMANPADLVPAIVGYLGVVPGLPLSEQIYFATRLLEFVTSSDSRRLDQYDKTTWWDFVRAEQFGPTYQNFLARALTRNLVAADSERASTRTIGLQATRILVANIVFSMYEEASRLLNGPTTEAWIDPWMRHLQGRGMRWYPDTSIDALQVQDGVVTGARVRTNGQQRTVSADLYVLAVPVERARELLGPPLRAIDPGFAALDGMLADWMTGVQFFLRRPLPIARGHVSYADSPWALTSVSQGQFWSRDLSTYGDGTVRDVLSVDVSNWDSPGVLYGKPARACTEQQILDEVWVQMKRSLDEDGVILVDGDVVDRFIDPAIQFGPAGTPVDNAEPLLVNTVDLWKDRPAATTRVPNLFLASDYVRTNTDLATMEGANEAARRAVNGILDRTGSSASRARIWNFEEPAVFAASRLQDSLRHALGLPHVLADRS